MTEFFNALKNFKPRPKNKYTVTVEGKTVEVTKEVFIKVRDTGEDQWMWTDDQLVRRPPRPSGRMYRELSKADEGYVFVENDPYWPIGVKKEGYVWRTK